jgi:hypothetical protein
MFQGVQTGCRISAKSLAEMALSILAHNLTRVMNTVGIKPLISAIAA